MMSTHQTVGNNVPNLDTLANASSMSHSTLAIINTNIATTAASVNKNGSPATSSSDSSAVHVQKKKDAEKKRREEQRKLGTSFEEEEVKLDDNGSIVSIKDIPIAKLSLETLKAFARKLRLKINSNISKGGLLCQLGNYRRLDGNRDVFRQSQMSSSSNGTGNSLPSGLLHTDVVQ
jgi:hypothetical protein